MRLSSKNGEGTESVVSDGVVSAVVVVVVEEGERLVLEASVVVG